MKELENKLTLQETEQLCRLYMECRLSALEEVELQYILGKFPYNSPLIAETRLIMGISCRSFAGGRMTESGKHSLWKRRRFIGAVAAIAVFIGIGSVTYYKLSVDDKAVYIAYANGEVADEFQSRLQVDADMKKAEKFMAQVEALKIKEQQKLNNFMNHKSMAR